VRRTEDLGLVEIKHALRLKSFDPFVMASQVTQVYYLSYPCKDRDLSPWWVVYQVAPHGCVPLNGANDESMSSEHIIHDVYQEDGLDGTFVVDLGEALDSLVSLGSDEITDVVDLEAIERAMVEDEEYDEEGHTTEEEDEAIADESDEETYDQDDY
jgi:hypothetical protein